MKYVNNVDPKNPNWFHVAENIATGGWNITEACAGTGHTVDEIKFEMMRLGANLQGANVIAALATKALNTIENAQKDAPKPPTERASVLAEPMPPPGPITTAAARSGASVSRSGAVVGGGLSAGTVAGVALGVVAIAAGVNYARSGSRVAGPGPGVVAVRSTANPTLTPGAASVPTAAVGGLTCTRGDAIVTQLGRSLRQTGDSVAFEDPDTRTANTIAWQPPPATLRLDEVMALETWSTHNQGRPMEVQWESGTDVGFEWGYGASSKPEYANEGRKTTRLRFKGGSVRLKGGVNYGSADESFRLQWDYYCKP